MVVVGVVLENVAVEAHPASGGRLEDEGISTP